MAKKSLIKSIHDTMWDLMAADERVLIMGEDVGVRGGVFRATEGFIEKFGEERVIDTPLAESSIVGHGIGMALGGLLPIIEIQFADFIHPAFNQIVQEAARMRYRSTATSTARSSSGRPTARVCTGRSTTPSPSRRSSPTCRG